jgi:hypothetical protein
MPKDAVHAAEVKITVSTAFVKELPIHFVEMTALMSHALPPPMRACMFLKTPQKCSTA